jgi:O-antigen/teichoic acid export membrane protein
LASKGDATIISGSVIFFDSFMGAITGYLFWILGSRFIIPDQFGLSTSMLSLIAIYGSVFGLGIEYVLLRDVRRNQDLIGIALVVELGISLGLVPTILFYYWLLSGSWMSPLSLIACSILVVQNIGFVVKYSIIGFMKMRVFLFADSIGYIIRIPVLFFLSLSDASGTSLLWPVFLTTSLPVLLMSLYLFRGYSLRSFKKGYRDLLKASVPSISARISTFLLSNFGVVLYSILTKDAVGAGAFFILLIITSAISNFGVSLALAAIPHSVEGDGRLPFAASGRVGLAVTVPIITLFFLSPNLLLHLFGNESSQNIPFIILLVAQIPTIVLSNECSRLIRTNDMRGLVYAGFIQLLVLFILFPSLVTIDRLSGAAIAVALSVTFGSIFSLFRTESWHDYNFLPSFGSLLLGVVVGNFVVSLSPLISFASAAVSTFCLFAFRALTKADLMNIPAVVSYLVKGKS